MEKKELESVSNIGTSVYTTEKIIDEYSYIGARQAHGFIAEIANDNVDRALLKDSRIIGDNNLKNGADRLVDGIQLQTKYCNSAYTSVNSAFGSEGIYKYYNTDGTPMVLEVPKDQYNEAIEIMKRRIQDGKIPGLNNPNEAINLIRKGHFNYNTCAKIAKLGTIEGLVYDVSNSFISSSFVGGISSAVSLAFNLINTGDVNKSIKEAVKVGRNAFTVSITSQVISTQLIRSEIVRNFVNRIGTGVFGSMISSGVILGIQTISDIRKLFNDEISVEAFLRNLKKNTVTAMSALTGAAVGKKIGGNIGMFVGAVGGALIGSKVGEQIFGYPEKQVNEKLKRLYNDLQVEIDKMDDIEISNIDVEKIKALVQSEEGIRRLVNDYNGVLYTIKSEINKQLSDIKLPSDEKIVLLDYEKDYISAERVNIEGFKIDLTKNIIEIENRVNRLTKIYLDKLSF